MSENQILINFNEIIERCRKIMIEKNQEYSNNNNVLSNFDETASELGITVLQSWGVFFKKHISSIINYCKCGQVISNETIENRIADAINYLIILYSIIKRENNINTININNINKLKNDGINNIKKIYFEETPPPTNYVSSDISEINPRFDD